MGWDDLQIPRDGTIQSTPWDDFFVPSHPIRSPDIYKEQCLFVCPFIRYAFSPCNSYRHQTFHDTSLGPEEGPHGIGITKKGHKGGTRVKFHPDDLYIN